MIVSSDTVLCVRAVVLLGQVLHLASLLLPHEIGSLSQSLPQLAQHVATQHYVSQQQYCRVGATRARIFYMENNLVCWTGGIRIKSARHSLY